MMQATADYFLGLFVLMLDSASVSACSTVYCHGNHDFLALWSVHSLVAVSVSALAALCCHRDRLFMAF